MFSKRYLLTVGALGALLCIPGPALAQDTIDILENYEIQRSQERTLSELPLNISFKDCDERANVRFPATIRTARIRSYEIWAGTKPCDTAAARENEMECQQIQEGEASSDTFYFDLNSREIVGEDCIGTQGTTQSITRTLFFAFISPEGVPSEAQGETDTLTITYDVIAPDGPDFNELGQGDGLLVPKWTQVEGSDVAGYRFYCEPSSADPDDVPADGLGSGGQGGDSGAGCVSNLSPGQRPDEDKFCGEQAGESAGRGTISGLENNQLYAVGIVSTDTVGNVGELSNVICQYPKEVTDFYEAYTEAGGKGGGGFCSMGYGRGGAGWTLAALFGFGVQRVRRRRRGA